MRQTALGIAVLSLGLGFFAGYPLTAGPTTAPTTPPRNSEDQTMTQAAGSFDVKVTPQTPDALETAQALGRLALDKKFHGDLEATSQGVMLSSGTAVEGSAGYVAIERVSGTLRGKKGSFVLQHLGTMRGGAFNLTIQVLPDSGTGDLAGLSGAMQIHIAPDGAHTYTFDYAHPAAP